MNGVVFLISALSLILLNRQTASESIQLFDVTIDWQNTGISTDFNVSWTPSIDTFTYVSIGLNTVGFMSGSNAVVCYAGESATVQHNFNNGYSSSIMNINQPKIGLSNTYVAVNNGKVSCKFTRDNSNSQSGYISVTPEFSLYLIVAYGSGN